MSRTAWLWLMCALVTACTKTSSDGRDGAAGAPQGAAGTEAGTGGSESSPAGLGPLGESGGGGSSISGYAGSSGRAPLPGEAECEHAVVESRCADGWCAIPGGCFVMGSPTSEFGHSARGEDQVVVTIGRAFEIMSHEVTLRDWEALLPPIVPSSAVAQAAACMDPECPAGDITFSEALDFANRLSLEAGLLPCYELGDCTGEAGQGRVCASITAAGDLLNCEGYRLPSDAEYEYVARASTTTAFYSGPGDTHPDALNCYEEPNLDRIGWYCKNSGGGTRPVGGKEPNAWGLFDTAGNVAELVSDAWTGRSLTGPLHDPHSFAATAELVTARGGQVLGSQRTCRSASHLPWFPGARSFEVGFRLARTLP